MGERNDLPPPPPRGEPRYAWSGYLGEHGWVEVPPWRPDEFDQFIARLHEVLGRIEATEPTRVDYAHYPDGRRTTPEPTREASDG